VHLSVAHHESKNKLEVDFVSRPPARETIPQQTSCVGNGPEFLKRGVKAAMKVLDLVEGLSLLFVMGGFSFIVRVKVQSNPRLFLGAGGSIECAQRHVEGG
jgi:hypothetical protein